MRRLHIWLMCSLLGLLFSFSSCSKTEEAAEPVIRPVRYQQVFATGGTRTRTFSGTAQAGTETNLSFKVPGTVQNVLVRVGDSVAKGQLLARLEEQDYRLQVQEAEAALEQAMAQARNAGATYNRVRELYESRSASKSDLDGARAASESADAAVKTIEKRLELARLQVKYTQLSSPANGLIAAVNIEVNENLAAGQPVIMLTSGTHPEVKVSIPEAMIGLIKSGQTATVTFGALSDEILTATVTEVGVASTGFETTFPVIVRLQEATRQVRPGMAAEVTFRLETADARERIFVPAVAVAEDRLGRYVYTVEPAGEGLGVVRRHAVVIGELTSEGLEIIEGLADGDLVVTAGVTRLIEGQKVRLL